jgi:dihydropteroate synthase
MYFRHFDLDLATPRVMGILNVTPDSFSDGGRWLDPGRALDHALAMVAAGADIIDIGGESTRPGAAPVDEESELGRIVPLIERLAPQLPVPISIDSSKPRVMQAAVAAGASMINDVMALRQPGALAMAAALQVPVCLMHMQGEPRTMQQAPTYHNVVSEVAGFLQQRATAAIAAGIDRQQIILDPGFGFGKRLEDNLVLCHHLPRLNRLGYPLLVGMSRKSMIAGVLSRAVDERLAASLALASLAAWQGAAIIRVHDVAESVDAVRMMTAVRVAGEALSCG